MGHTTSETQLPGRLSQYGQILEDWESKAPTAPWIISKWLRGLELP